MSCLRRPEQTDAALAGLSDGPVHVHLDPDVLDPEVFPVPYNRPGGLGAGELLELVAAVAACGPVASVEITAFHAPPDAATRDPKTELLAHAVARLVR